MEEGRQVVSWVRGRARWGPTPRDPRDDDGWRHEDFGQYVIVGVKGQEEYDTRLEDRDQREDLRRVRVRVRAEGWGSVGV